MIQWSPEKTTEWLRTRISLRSGFKTTHVDPDEPLSSYGLTSMEAITLTAELEEALGIRIEPTLVWEYPSINSLVAHLYQDARNET
jgi:polyketide synthase 13